ncbi:MAG: DUF1523 family protein [Candidatus Aenigmatarchaeota archaeon]
MGYVLKLLGVVAVATALIGSCVGPHFRRPEYVAEVTEKVVKRYGNSDKYLLFTRLNDGSTRVLENTDSLFEWKFDSSDIQAGIEPGKTYQFKTYGFRAPFLSWYENILSAEEVKEQN